MRVFRFEPTYEELKHFKPFLDMQNLILFWAYLWGIETYLQHLGVDKELQSFEPTYEELKHPHSRVSLVKIVGFWAYLWGIETLNLVTGK